MDTKWKNIRYSIGFKIIATLLCVAGALSATYGLLKVPYFEYVMQDEAYINSEKKDNTLRQVYHWVNQAVFYYKSEAHIKSGDSLSVDVLNHERQNLLWEQERYLSNIQQDYDQMLTRAVAFDNAIEAQRLIEERDESMRRLREEYVVKLESVKTQLIQSQLASYEWILNQLNELSGFYYAVLYADGKTYSNLDQGTTDPEAFFKTLPTYVSGRPEPHTSYGLSRYSTDQDMKDSMIYVGMQNERFAQEASDYTMAREMGMIGVYQSLAGILLFILGLIYLIYVAGRKADKDGVHLQFLDRLYLDVGLFMLLSIEYLCMIGLYSMLTHGNVYYRSYVKTMSVSELQIPYTQLVYILGGLLIVIGVLFALSYTSMVVKRLKRGECIRHTLVFVVFHSACMWIYRGFTKLQRTLNNGPDILKIIPKLLAYTSAVTFTIMLSIILGNKGGAVGFFIGFLLFCGVNVAALLYELRSVAHLNAISFGVEQIKGGNLTYRIPENNPMNFRILSQNINNIADGLKSAVENEVKAERMKSELITNVSHDLKTPLTSILTYIDLLKTEGLSSPNAEKYLKVLDTKSERLKNLTEDLFEAAKAASGSLMVNHERLDIGSLLSQGLGELKDRMDASGLDFRVTVPTEKLFAKGDGRMMWRVLENLLSNIFKYSLTGSRVYIDAIQNGDKVVLTMKNISACALNVNPDELLERFKRGDESRHGEGSGLGLSIAMSLTEIQGGTFKISIDGDLFKAEVFMPCYIEEA